MQVNVVSRDATPGSEAYSNDLTAEHAESTEEDLEEIALHVLLCGLGVLCGKCI
jgi:hypothetical protein